MLAGTRDHYAERDCVVMIDGDLQDPPELIPSLVGKWLDGYNVVIAQRESRPERGFRFRLQTLLSRHEPDH